ncbi:hypothetical protein FLO80_13750 [Aquicoccus porphyridii]|uniref:Uncharacterized protein n=1 Tax=Aquicoccus porphyridii TaxID=1852029 RepID=A0A5A9Z742_9RHOB|nr:hypothetical protein [Aquicoccus porphyridii]KAA0912889.1 hypothetical protein FLO80_13750 [Aquicoccus porphyridii]
MSIFPKKETGESLSWWFFLGENTQSHHPSGKRRVWRLRQIKDGGLRDRHLSPTMPKARTEG